LGCWFAPCYGPFSLGARFETYESVISFFFFFFFFFFFYGATARGGPWPPLQYASKHLDPLLYLSIRLFPSFSGP
jgi:hypothetical protein